MKQKNLMVKVCRFDENKNLVEVVVHINECTKKDKQWARCPECNERVRLNLKGDKHYEHETRAASLCKFKTAA